MLKTLKYIFLSIIIILISLVSYIYVTMYLSKPVMSGELLIKGLENQVSIYRDDEGIPHIYAKKRKDMYFALGFVMASDRLFQYDIIRRAGSGTLSEIIGNKTKEVDILFRTLGANIRFKDAYKSLPDEVKNDFKSFTEGLNYYVKNNSLPIEFKILGYTPKKFSIMDAYYVYTYMAYSFSPMLKEDLLHSEILKTVKDRDLKLLLSNPINDEMKYVKNNTSNLFDAFVALDKIDDILGYLGPIEGSNAWLVSGDMTKSKSPILSSDPHISFSLPNIWYEAHLKCEEDGYEMYGHFLPLIPYPALGHNEDYGWGLTMSYVDDLDLFQEEIKDNKYMHAGLLKELKVYKEIIRIKGESDYQYDLKWTRGPIVDELLKTKNVSMKWAFFNKDNRPMMSFYRIGRGIKSMDDFKDAVSIGKSPGLNILYADKKGNIAHFVYGSFFQRSNANASHLVGEAKDFITGEYDYELKHHRINPKDGMLISTNDMPDESRVILKGLWYPKNRHDTTKSLLEKRDDWTMDSMRKVQTSNLDIFAKKFSDIMISDLSNTVMSENEKIAFKFLKKWNHISDLESVGASIYHRMNYELFPLILDEMPEEMMKRYVLSTGSWSFIQRIFPLEENSWWDISATEEIIETRSTIIEMAFKNTVKNLTVDLGKDPIKWSWGRLHTITYPHPLGMNKLLGKFFNEGPFPIPGAINVINHNRRKGYLNGHAVASGPSTRRIIDFSKPKRSYGILPLGNSGHQLSPFYDNQRERFISGEFRYQLMDLNDIKENLYSTLILKSPSLKDL